MFNSPSLKSYIRLCNLKYGTKGTNAKKLSQDTALSRFVSHYNKTVELFKSGSGKESMVELGRTTRFLDDLSTPVHTHKETVASAVSNTTDRMDIINFGVYSAEHSGFEPVCDDLSQLDKYTDTGVFEDDRYEVNFDINSGKNGI